MRRRSHLTDRLPREVEGSVRVGDGWIRLGKLEALRCPYCGLHIDLTDREKIVNFIGCVDRFTPDLKLTYFRGHVLGCVDASKFMWKDGELRVDGESWGEPELQPLVKP